MQRAHVFRSYLSLSVSGVLRKGHLCFGGLLYNAEAYSAVYELRLTCCKPNWDDRGADPKRREYNIRIAPEAVVKRVQKYS